MKLLRHRVRQFRTIRWLRFLPLLLWPVLGSYLFFLPPSQLPVFLGFYLLLLAALVGTLRLFFTVIHTITLALATVTFLFLRQFHLTTHINLGFLTGLTLIGLYSEKIMRWKNRRPTPPPPSPPSDPAPPSSQTDPPPSLVRSFPADFLND